MEATFPFAGTSMSGSTRDVHERSYLQVALCVPTSERSGPLEVS